MCQLSLQHWRSKSCRTQKRWNGERVLWGKVWWYKSFFRCLCNSFEYSIPWACKHPIHKNNEGSTTEVAESHLMLWSITNLFRLSRKGQPIRVILKIKFKLSSIKFQPFLSKLDVVLVIIISKIVTIGTSCCHSGSPTTHKWIQDYIISKRVELNQSER